VSDTKQRILDEARRLFNENGLHRVGVRDIARALDMSPGNLAYHFATKDDLVTALLKELHDRNARTVFADLPSGLSLVGLYHAAVGAMRNILVYRFVLLSYADAVSASPELLRLEIELGAGRRQRSELMLELLVRDGALDARAVAKASYLHEQGELLSSGWLHAAAFRPELDSDRAIVLHYAKVGCALLQPYCSKRGRRQMQVVLSGALDAMAWPVSRRETLAEPAAKDYDARQPRDERRRRATSRNDR
jgi:AcrR family transcriptional regulator